jgi:hypothetical protein
MPTTGNNDQLDVNRSWSDDCDCNYTDQITQFH